VGALLFEPHNLGDDAVLFACFTMLRDRPHVVTVLQGHAQARLHGFQVTAEERMQESRDAIEGVLGLTWTQWPFSDLRPDWERVQEWMVEERDRVNPERVWAPAVEEGGNPHHTTVATIAREVFGDRCRHYLTYTEHRVHSNGGVAVEFENEWVALKLRAMACYGSQIRLQSTSHHFQQGVAEWVEA